MNVAFPSFLKSVRVQTALVIGLVAIFLVTGLSGLFASVLESQIHRERGSALAAIARSVSMNLALGMQAQRRQVMQLAEADELWEHGLDDRRVHEALTRIRASRPFAAWLGVTDANGVVRSAAGGLLLGHDVTARPWFQAGRQSVFVGDVHEAKLLASLLPRSASGEPVRLVDFAAPIRREGRVIGVVAMHGNWDWAGSVVESVLSQGAEAAIEVFIVNDANRLLYASRSDAVTTPDALEHAVQATSSSARCPECPEGALLPGGDGNAYLTAGSELRAGPGASPLGLGWHVLVRQPASVAYAEVRRGTAMAFAAGTCTAIAAALLAWFAAGALSRPMVQLSRAASAVERGDRGAAIPLLASNVEVAELSTALSSMTRRLLESNEQLEARVAQRTDELRQSHEQLERINIEQHAMLDNDLVGIVRVRQGTIVWKNRAMERMFGYGPDELLGQSARILYASDEAWNLAHAEADRALRAHGRHSGQVEMRRRSGDALWVDLNATLLSPRSGEALVLMSDITAMKQHQSQVEHIAFHDALTGLANRLLLADRLKHALDINERLRLKVGLCCIDLDGFKAVNDQLGHEAGDDVLRAVAQRLLSCVRSSDTVARLGGDEFVLVLAPLASAEDCMVVLQRVVEAVRQPVMLAHGGQARVSASVGVAFSPDHGTAARSLLKMADEAMYEAKRSGKNGVRVHDGPGTATGALRALEMAGSRQSG